MKMIKSDIINDSRILYNFTYYYEWKWSKVISWMILAFYTILLIITNENDQKWYHKWF